MRFHKPAIAALALFVMAPFAVAQTPRISHIMPMGGQAGTSFELAVRRMSRGTSRATLCVFARSVFVHLNV